MLMERIIISSNAEYFAPANNTTSISNEALLDKLKNCTLIVDKSLKQDSFLSTNRFDNNFSNKQF